MQRRNKTGRSERGDRRSDENDSDKDGSRTVYAAAEYARMCHRAHRTVVTGELGIVGMYVSRLDKAGEGNQQNAQQRHQCKVCVFPRCAFTRRQEQNLTLRIFRVYHS